MTLGLSARKAAAPKQWSGWTWVMTTCRIGFDVRFTISERSHCPSARLPPDSVTSTASLPTMKPMLAIASSFSGVASAFGPRRMKMPGPTSSIAKDSAEKPGFGRQHRQNPPKSAARRDSTALIAGNPCGGHGRGAEPFPTCGTS